MDYPSSPKLTTAQVDSMFEWINHGLSTYQDNSLISAFNNNSKALWEDTTQLKYFMSDMFHFVGVIAISMDLYDSCQGAFDPSAAGLFDLWNQAKQNKRMPDSSEVLEAKSHAGLIDLDVDQNGFPFKADSLFQLNFNAVAKGYAVDVIAEFLNNKQVINYMVEIGGEVRCRGKNVTNELWSIGINTPTIGSTNSEVFEVIQLDNESIATSGNYRNYFEIDGKTLGHTIDPRTGYPVMNEMRSASVIHKYCAEADAYATACMVLGYEESKKMIQRDSAISGYFIFEKDGKLIGEFID
jgi:thiamine biosynthesis lipoprotein